MIWSSRVRRLNSRSKCVHFAFSQKRATLISLPTDRSTSSSRRLQARRLRRLRQLDRLTLRRRRTSLSSICTILIESLSYLCTLSSQPRILVHVFSFRFND